MTKAEVNEFANVEVIPDDLEELEACGSSEKATPSEQAQGMLLFWRRTSGRYATRDVLAKALIRIGKASLCDILNAGTASSSSGTL